jgi:hypothetical protein
VIDECGNIRTKECDLRVEDLDGRKGTSTVEHLEELKNLVAVPPLFFHIDEIG